MWLSSYLSVFYLNDIVEIGVLSALILMFSYWCARDKRTPLLIYFYGWCACGIILGLCPLPTVHTLMIACWPALFIVFIMFHQHTLQKNYVAGKTIIPAQSIAPKAWLSLVIRAGIKAAVQQKNIIFIMCGRTSIDDFIEGGLPINGPASKELFDMLIESVHIKSGTLVVLGPHGLVRLINGSWKASTENTGWREQAIVLTAHTDALVCTVDCATRLCTIIAQGTCVEQVASDKADAIMTQFVRKQQFVSSERAV